MASSKRITLKSSDGVEFEVDKIVAMEFGTIRPVIEDECPNDAIPLFEVKGEILSKVIQYCKKHVEARAEKGKADEGSSADKALKTWDENFMKVDLAMLYDLILAANYMDIKGLLDLSCRTVAFIMKGKTIAEIRNLFHIKYDFTPEEEEEIRRENQWAFE